MLVAFAPIALAVAAALTPLLHRRLGRDTGWPLAALFAVCAALYASQAPAIADRGAVEASWPWFDTLDAAFRLRLDSLSLVFVLVILGVGALVMAYCARYFGAGGHARVFTLMTLFALSMLLLVLADDVLLLFAAWELTALCSFLLIGGLRPGPAPPALRALLTTGLGGLALLAGLVLLSLRTGTTRIGELLSDPAVADGSATSRAVIVLIIVAAATKSAQIPFHFWLPDAMVAVTPVSAYLHAAAMVKAGVYLLMRCSGAFAGDPVWTWTLVCVGLSGAVIGALFALQQHDLKLLLAYSTVSQLGFMVALTGVGTAAALAAATALMVAHALFKANLFMLVGIVDRQMGSRDLRELTGLRRVMPVTAVLTGLAAMSLAGLPPLLGYVAKEELFKAVAEMPAPERAVIGCAAAAVAAAGLTFAYGLRMVVGAFGGPTGQPRLREASVGFLAPSAAAAAGSLGLGIAAAGLSPFVEQAVEAALARPVSVHLRLWHGWSPEMAMTSAAYAFGTVLFVARDPVELRIQRLRLPFDGVTLFDRCHDRLSSFGARIASLTQRRSPARHLLVPPIALALIGAAYVVGERAPPTATGPATESADWLLVAALATAVAVAITQRSRMGLVIGVGLTGLVLALWYLRAGAPGLAATQVLVEIMIVVVAALVLRSLPRRFRARGRRRTWTAAVPALVAGGAAGAAVLYLTGRREPSPAAEYLLEHTRSETGGVNAVNAVLVHFRALDTLGETTVLATAALGVAVLARQTRPDRPPNWNSDTADSLLLLEVVRRLLVPVLAVASVVLVLRGHHAPGGGFVGGLVAGGAMAMSMLSRPPLGRPQFQRIEVPALAAGLAAAVGTGIAAMAAGRPFLTPMHVSFDVGGAHLSLSTTLLFDMGVYLVVAGAVAAALNGFAHHETDLPDSRGAREVIP